jgi:hypothetical protein
MSVFKDFVHDLIEKYNELNMSNLVLLDERVAPNFLSGTFEVVGIDFELLIEGKGTFSLRLNKRHFDDPIGVYLLDKSRPGTEVVSKSLIDFIIENKKMISNVWPTK